MAIFLNDGLQRIILDYAMVPDSSSVHNFQIALAKHYCDLEQDLNDAVKLARSGNVGQKSQVQFACKQKNGDIFLQITNGQESSLVELFISSPEYTKYLTKNEYEDAFGTVAPGRADVKPVATADGPERIAGPSLPGTLPATQRPAEAAPPKSRHHHRTPGGRDTPDDSNNSDEGDD
jgi:hypothetical protein